MLTCPSCGTSNLRGSTVVEHNLVTLYTLKKNPSGGSPTIVVSGYDNSNSSYTLVCIACGAENVVEDASFTIAKK